MSMTYQMEATMISITRGVVAILFLLSFSANAFAGLPDSISGVKLGSEMEPSGPEGMKGTWKGYKGKLEWLVDDNGKIDLIRMPLLYCDADTKPDCGKTVMKEAAYTVRKGLPGKSTV